MEISFRIWQCHGTLEAIPCSRVAHIFRSNVHWQGQVFSVDYHVTRNKLRAAEVWMDEYKEIVKRVMSKLPDGVDLGPLNYMQNVRKAHQCKSFRWYLDNVFPELFVPDERMVKAQGAVVNSPSNKCFDTLGQADKYGGKKIGVYGCHGMHGTQEFLLTIEDEIRIAQGSYSVCAAVDRNSFDIVMYKCVEKEGAVGKNVLRRAAPPNVDLDAFKFKYEPNESRIYIPAVDKCVTVGDHIFDGTHSYFRLYAANCEKLAKNQVWDVVLEMNTH